METWQMIKELTENPGKEFKTKDYYGNKMVAYNVKEFVLGELTSNDAIVTKDFDGKIELLTLNDFMKGREWEEVRKSVTWQEAFEAWVNGKGFTIEYQGNIYKQPKMNKLGCFGINVSNGFEERMFIEGTWYIED